MGVFHLQCGNTPRWVVLKSVGTLQNLFFPLQPCHRLLVPVIVQEYIRMPHEDLLEYCKRTVVRALLSLSQRRTIVLLYPTLEPLLRRHLSSMVQVWPC